MVLAFQLNDSNKIFVYFIYKFVENSQNNRDNHLQLFILILQYFQQNVNS